MGTLPPIFVFVNDATRTRLAAHLRPLLPGYRSSTITISTVRADPLGFQARVAYAVAIIAPEALSEEVRALAADVAPVVISPGWQPQGGQDQ